jgi:spore coat polysaccharide biosynthesis protein SpsF
MNLRPHPVALGIVLARLDSSRLPGKALRVCAGLPLVEHAIVRARSCRSLSGLVLATTDRAVDDRLVEYARSMSIPVFRGDVDDVAGRVLACAREHDAEYLLRINGDSPFLDPELVDEAAELVGDGEADLVTNLIDRTFPYGIAVEILRTATLADAHPRMTPAEREHVTQHFYNRLGDWPVRSFRSDRPELSGARLVVDTEEDLAQFERLAERLGPELHTAGFAQVASLSLSHAADGACEHAPYGLQPRCG